MKFFALSAFIGLGFLAQKTEATLDSNEVVSSFSYGLPTVLQSGSTVLASGPSSSFSMNQGLQNLINSLNYFSNIQASTQSTNKSTVSTSSNLKVEPVKQTQTKRVPHNPLDDIERSRWGFFDNFKKQFCSNPRVWDGKACKCPNNGCFLSGKCYQEPPKETNKDLMSLRYINRNFDGTQNNPNHPEWGSKGSELLRLCAPNYQDGKSVMWEHLPQPRYISNLVGEVQGPIKQSRLGLNMLFNLWGQFLDHDITLSPTTQDEPMNIEIPKCDKFMDKKCTGKEEFPITRSIHTPAQVRTNINVLTPWIDASQVYGSDKATADSLREFKKGKLRTSEGNLLPKNANGGFVAGDFRVDENVALTCFQTIFMREHNRICDVVLQKNSSLTDEEVFQIARNYVIGLVQHVTFDQYLPALLGKSNFDQFIGSYKYDSNANPNVFTEFSTAAFRLGHPLINAPFKKMDNYGNVIDQLELGEMFFNPSLVTNDSVTQFLNGLARTASKQRSLELVKDLRNFLFFPPNAEVKLDLFSFNVQRGRDHGVCSVKEAREKMGLPQKSFKDLFENQEKAGCLQKLYQDSKNLDLWLGIIGQKAQKGSALGELGIRMNSFQFKNMRNGDKFWYQNVYPESIVKQIKATSFGDIIKRNSGVKYVNSDTFKKL